MKKDILVTVFCLLLLILVSCSAPYSFMPKEPDNGDIHNSNTIFISDEFSKLIDNINEIP